MHCRLLNSVYEVGGGENAATCLRVGVAGSQHQFLDTDGESAKVIREADWSASVLGPIDRWPAVLKTTIAMMLRSAFPKALVWGPELITFHNDAFRPILGEKPPAIGLPFSEVWAEAWNTIGPFARNAMNGKATFIENLPLTVNRNGSDEQAYFTFCYSPVVDFDGRVLGFMDTVIETTQQVLAQERANVLNAELAHRIRNVLTLVGSIVSQTIRAGGSPEQTEKNVNRRLMALANVQDVLRANHATKADIHGIVSTALAPHGLEKGRVVVDGPNVRLSEPEALALALALNELLTNAIKYGSLSNDAGTVTIRWEAGKDTPFQLVWRERGGPVVTAPQKTGFGSRLIQRHVAATFGGTAHMTFDPQGIIYEIRQT